MPPNCAADEMTLPSNRMIRVLTLLLRIGTVVGGEHNYPSDGLGGLGSYGSGGLGT